MQVDDRAFQRLDGLRAEDAHVAGEDDKLRPDCLERVGQGLVGSLAFADFAEFWHRDDQRVDPLLDRPIDGGTVAVGKDDGNFGVERAAPDCRLQGTQVASGSRNANRDPVRHAAPPPSGLPG